MICYKKNLKLLSRKLRKASTQEEIILWNKIRKKQILDVQFYRQRPLNSYIVDFYAPKVKLVIELDGSQHYEEENLAYDLLRSEVLECLGLIVKRYTNVQIRTELNFVLDDIYYYIQKSI